MTTSFTLDLLVEPEQLLLHLDHPDLRIIDLSRASVYEQLHIPYAVHLAPARFTRTEEMATGLFPNEEQVQQLITQLNISPQHHVVVYDDEGGAWAGRLIWTLHCLGFEQTSLLNGGIHAWLAAGHPTTTDAQIQVTVETLFTPNTEALQKYRIEYAALLEQVQQGRVQLWDCRSEDEYTGLRLAARRGGHIPNAMHYEWSTALNRQNHLKLHPLARTRSQLEQKGFDLTQPVVVYCQSHHRSGLAYIIGRLLNWPVRAYDGAWSEWGNRLDSPIVAGETPN